MQPMVTAPILAASFAVAMTGTRAAAEPVALADRWPSAPPSRALSLEAQLTDQLTELGNLLGRHLELLSHDTFVLKVDCRKRRAHLRIGGGNDQVLALRLEGEVRFEDLDAHIAAHVDLAFRGHALRLELPAFALGPTWYRGDYGIAVRLPLFARSF
jgi:hypothetical protein